MDFYADTETAPKATYDKYGRTFIWMWGMESENGEYIEGYHVNGLLQQIITREKNSIIWFHNLKFDFAFIENFLLTTGWTEVIEFPTKREDIIKADKRTYSVLRDAMGNVYSVTMFNNKKQPINLFDSAKVYPMTIANMGEMFGFPKLCDDYDYNKVRKPDDKPTDKERGYMRRDIKILGIAIKKLRDRFQGEIGRTISGIAFKEMVGLAVNGNDYDISKSLKEWKANKKKFDKVFPPTNVELAKEISPAYSGGMVMVNEKIMGKKAGFGMTIDVNSLYPFVLQSKMFPYGNAKYFVGEHSEEDFPLYVQTFRASFTLKKNGFPSLPKKLGRISTGVRDSKELYKPEITLTNIDLKHFLINYDVEEIEYVDGYEWKQTLSPFRGIVDIEGANKVKASLEGNKIDRTLAKLMMNSSYGKLGQSIKNFTKVAYLDEDGVTRYTPEMLDDSAKSFLPGAIFTTAWARDVLFNGIYAVGIDRFLYCDTDSIHIKGHTLPKKLPIDQNKLGYWKIESYFKESKFLRDKTYVEVQQKMDKYYVKRSQVRQNVEDYEFDEFDRADVKFKDLAYETKNKILDDLKKHPLQIKGAGMTDIVKRQIKTIDDFGYGVEVVKQANGRTRKLRSGKIYKGQLKGKQVPGGVILVPSEMAISRPITTLNAEHYNMWGKK